MAQLHRLRRSSSRVLFERVGELFRPFRKEDRDVKELSDKLEDLIKLIVKCREKVEELEETNSVQLQNISELRATLRKHRKLFRTIDSERETWIREREELEDRVAQLEDILEIESLKWEVENEKIYRDLQKAVPKQNLSIIKETWKLCEKNKMILEEEKDKKTEAQEQLQKAALQVANLHAALRQQGVEVNKIRLEKLKRNALQQIIISNLKDNMMRCEKDKISAVRAKESVMKEYEQLEKRVAELEAELAHEQEKRKREKHKISSELWEGQEQ
ncbi:hypothetical protein C0J50_18821 [Silurus asotus]|uniref:Uncharacterized protein n=1 Tax=Silurus asotus TaxID=30991 RepID=A0AAD5FN28_SILAS|nr:hypothetical protein C0J50_18821 [Silurus asotus]